MRLSIVLLLSFLAFPLMAANFSQESATGITHSFLATGQKTYIMKFDKDATEGKIEWEYPASTREGWVLPNGNILLAVSKGGKYPSGAAVEISRDLKVIWEYKGTQEEVNSIQKTADNTYVLTEAGKNPRLLEIDAAGKIVVEFPLDCQKGNGHMETRMSRKLSDGTYLCPHLLDFAIKQYDKDGKVLSTIKTDAPNDPEHKTHTWPFTAIRLANGNTLAGLTHSCTLAEFNGKGERVWEVTNSDVGGIIKDACGVQRLPNGNTIVCSYAAGANLVKVWEVTPEKKVVWVYKSAEQAGVHEIHVFETNGVALEGTPLR